MREPWEQWPKGCAGLEVALLLAKDWSIQFVTLQCGHWELQSLKIHTRWEENKWLIEMFKAEFYFSVCSSHMIEILEAKQ